MEESIRLSELMGPGFHSSHRAVKLGATELVESGGRGSGKSSFLSLELVLQLVKRPDCHAAVLRKVGATLRTSAYAQVLWAIGALGLRRQFKCTVSPMECVYLPTGQKILFLGMDDPGKLKSLKMPFGFVGVVWFEEMDQFEAEEVRSAEQSLLRGGDFSLSLKSFNPPADPGHWANLYALTPKAGLHAHHSTYLELPEGWLGQRFLQDAQHLKQVNPVAYRHEYLGHAVGTGEQVFGNLRLEAIDPTGFPHSVSGVDWGWWPDPWAFNRVYYNAHQRTLYIFDEATRHRCSNADTAAIVREKTCPGELIVADSSEKKSIADYRAMGLRCRGAVKGPGSVAYSVKWLQSLTAIVIDPKRCPDTAREFAACVYVQGQIPDRDNHHIDAVRYAVGHLWRRS
jgi:PBSX family phage terminase large subunit